MLIDCQSFSPRMAGYQLKLGIGHSRMSGQPGDALMPKRVRRGSDARLLGVKLHNLLDSPGRVSRVASSLEKPTVVRMSGNVRPQGRGKRLAEQNISVLVALAAVDPDFVVLKVDVKPG